MPCAARPVRMSLRAWAMRSLVGDASQVFDVGGSELFAEAMPRRSAPADRDRCRF